MSRSYKKHPIRKDIFERAKKTANRRVRQKLKYENIDFSNGCGYKKIYPQYEICNIFVGIYKPKTDINYSDWFKFYKRK